MEITTILFAESTIDAFASDSYESNFYLQTSDASPDEDDDEDKEETETDSDGGDPPLNEDLVHSPVPLETGGKPK